MDWNSIVENIKIFFQQPVAIIGCSVGCLLFYTLTFISKTSFGKKNILRLQNKFNELKSTYDTLEAQTKEKVANLKDLYEEKVAIVENHTIEVENLLFAISENINNKKVKELVEKYKTLKEETKTQAEELIKQSSLAIDNKIKEVQAELDAYKTELKLQYETEIQKYKDELEELQKSLEEKKEQGNEANE